MSAKIASLIEQRQNVWSQAKELNDRSDDLTAEESEQWSRHMDEIDSLDAEIKQRQSNEERARRADELAVQYGDVKRSDGAGQAPKSQYDRDADQLRKLVAGETRAVEFTAEKRDLTVGSATAGGNTVPTGFYGQLVEHMIENSTIRQTGVTVITTDSGNDLEVPKTTTHPTAAIVTEGNAISESDAVFGQVTLQAYKYGFMTQLSNELETDTGVDLVGYLSRIGGEALGNGSGTHFVTGTGSSQPNGVATAATVGVTGGTGVSGAFTADELIELFYSVIGPYRMRSEWLMSSAGLQVARQLKGSDNNYLWQPGLQAGQPDTLLGRPIHDEPNVADPALDARSVVFGDLSKYFIRDVRGVRVERSADYAFGNDLVSYRFLLRTDGDLIDTTGAVKVFVGGAS